MLTMMMNDINIYNDNYVQVLTDWLLYGTSAQKGYQCHDTLLNKIWSRFVDKYNTVYEDTLAGRYKWVIDDAC